jgi:hypothetical protein
VSGRWRIGEENGSNGDLIIRDEYATQVEGIDAKYVLQTGVSETL